MVESRLVYETARRGASFITLGSNYYSFQSKVVPVKPDIIFQVVGFKLYFLFVSSVTQTRHANRTGSGRNVQN